MRAFAALALVGILAACDEPASPNEAKLVVWPDSARLFIQEIAFFTVVGDTAGVSWWSDAPDIASIDRTGRATGVGYGTTKVWAVRGRDSSSAAVIVNRILCAGSPTVSPANTLLHVGDSVRITVRSSCITPGGGFLWSSADTTIAVVETRETVGDETAGMVRARTTGQVVVTARAVSDPSLSGSVAVTIRTP